RVRRRCLRRYARDVSLTQEIVRDVEGSHHRDAVHAGYLAAITDLAHFAVEVRDRLREFRALLFIACDLVLASEYRDVDHQRRGIGSGFLLHSTGILASSASSRAVAC